MSESQQQPYTARNRLLRWPLMLIDRALRALRGTPQPPTRPLQASRILVCMQAHFGDLILASSVIPALRRAYPDAAIGFLVHPLAAGVLRDHPEVAAVHCVEHWHLARSTGGLPLRLLRHWRSSRQALAEIRRARYDLAIDLYHYFPNSIPLLGRSGIAQRIGWTSGGFGPLLTHAPRPIALATPVLERHRRLLAALDPRAGTSPLRPDLHLADDARQRWRALAQASDVTRPFIALHVGAHDAHRRWPDGNWGALAARLVSEKRRVVLLGHGEADETTCRMIEIACPEAINLCNRLDWPQFIAAVEACSVLVAHDSAAIHVAAGFDKPRVCLTAGINQLSIWLQPLPHSAVLMEPVACAPCGRPRGCASMECIRGVTVQRVAVAIDRVAAAGYPVTD